MYNHGEKWFVVHITNHLYFATENFAGTKFQQCMWGGGGGIGVRQGKLSLHLMHMQKS